MIKKIGVDELERLDLWEFPETTEALVTHLEASGLVLLDKGGFSRIFTHPKLGENVVVRITDSNDGWPGYVTRACGSPYAPRVDGLCFHRDRWIAVVERLEKCSDEEISKRRAAKDEDWFDLVQTFAGSRDPKEISRTSFHQRYPGIVAYFDQHLRPFSKLDRHLANVMLRNGEPVFQDPYGRMRPEFSLPHESWLA